jgi:hypothetical protein
MVLAFEFVNHTSLFFSLCLWDSEILPCSVYRSSPVTILPSRLMPSSTLSKSLCKFSLFLGHCYFSLLFGCRLSSCSIDWSKCPLHFLFISSYVIPSSIQSAIISCHFSCIFHLEPALEIAYPTKKVVFSPHDPTCTNSILHVASCHTEYSVLLFNCHAVYISFIHCIKFVHNL